MPVFLASFAARLFLHERLTRKDIWLPAGRTPAFGRTRGLFSYSRRKRLCRRAMSQLAFSRSALLLA